MMRWSIFRVDVGCDECCTAMDRRLTEKSIRYSVLSPENAISFEAEKQGSFHPPLNAAPLQEFQRLAGGNQQQCRFRRQYIMRFAGIGKRKVPLS